MTDEVVRRQLEKTIKSKKTRARTLGRDEEKHRREAAEIGRKRSALEAEIGELEDHLESLGGPIVEEPQTQGGN